MVPDKLMVEMKELAKHLQLHAGMDVETSLLGSVPYRRDPNSPENYVSVIPDWVIDLAHRHGFECVSADFTRNVYTFRLLVEPQLEP